MTKRKESTIPAVFRASRTTRTITSGIQTKNNNCGTDSFSRGQHSDHTSERASPADVISNGSGSVIYNNATTAAAVSVSMSVIANNNRSSNSSSSRSSFAEYKSYTNKQMTIKKRVPVDQNDPKQRVSLLKFLWDSHDDLAPKIVQCTSVFIFII